MAILELKNPIESLQGALTPRGIVHRRKMYRDSNGKIVVKGRQEAYTVEYPRDYKANPPKGAELANINCWREAANRAAQLMLMERNGGEIPENKRLVYAMNHVPIYYTWQQAEPLLRDFHARFEAQLPTNQNQYKYLSRSDRRAAASTAVSISPKRYIQFPAFLRAMLYAELKS